MKCFKVFCIVLFIVSVQPENANLWAKTYYIWDGVNICHAGKGCWVIIDTSTNNIPQRNLPEIGKEVLTLVRIRSSSFEYSLATLRAGDIFDHKNNKLNGRVVAWSRLQGPNDLSVDLKL
jgi:hypothetical protein